MSHLCLEKLQAGSLAPDRWRSMGQGGLPWAPIFERGPPLTLSPTDWLLLPPAPHSPPWSPPRRPDAPWPQGQSTVGVAPLPGCPRVGGHRGHLNQSAGACPGRTDFWSGHGHTHALVHSHMTASDTGHTLTYSHITHTHTHTLPHHTHSHACVKLAPSLGHALRGRAWPLCPPAFPALGHAVRRLEAAVESQVCDRDRVTGPDTARSCVCRWPLQGAANRAGGRAPHRAGS